MKEEQKLNEPQKPKLDIFDVICSGLSEKNAVVTLFVITLIFYCSLLLYNHYR